MFSELDVRLNIYLCELLGLCLFTQVWRRGSADKGVQGLAPASWRPVLQARSERSEFSVPKARVVSSFLYIKGGPFFDAD